MDDLTDKRKLIANNYSTIIERIYHAAHQVGRNSDAIRLVVVTKTFPIDVIQCVVEAGATNLGENYVEEAIPKILKIAGSQKINWHMVGHIQSRKAQSVCEYFQYVHSLDSVKLAERLSRFSADFDKLLPVWLEFNVGGEESKSGWNITQQETWSNLLPDIEKIFSLPGLDFLGVMTVPPYSFNPESARQYYRRLREFQQFLISQLGLTGFNELSMGMSADFEIAIQEGSTCVRIGQAILGPRPG